MQWGVRFAVVAVVAAAVTAAPASARVEDERGFTARDTLETQVLAELNAVRGRHRLVPLRVSRGLRAAADAHSTAMATGGFFAHASADGTAFWKRVQRYYPRGRFGTWSVGENLLWSSPEINAAGAIRMWLNSPAHRRILLNPKWREVGLSAVHAPSAPGAFGGREVTVLTADFGVRR